nr:isopentenyl-diphosphate Delta-isomerase [Acuticoccus sediminis]
MQEDTLIIVDRHDRAVGSGPKMHVHEQGLLHRAFSIFVFDRHGRLMLQRRARTKYHSGGLWTNTCCGHPRAGEDLDAAARRRLGEEMGFCCDLRNVGSFIYRADMQNGLIEHEYDHVYFGTFDGEPVSNPDEADEWRWIEQYRLLAWMQDAPEDFTAWFRTIFSPSGEVAFDILELWPAPGRESAPRARGLS